VNNVISTFYATKIETFSGKFKKLEFHYPPLRGRTVFVREPLMKRRDSLLDECQATLQFGQNGEFIVLVGVVVTRWHIDATHPDVVQAV